MAAPTISFTQAAAYRVSPGTQYDEGPLTIGADSRAVVVVVASNGSAPVNGIRVGASWAAGVALTKVADSGASGRNCSVWWLDDLSGVTSGDHIFVDYQSGAYNAQATGYVLDHPTTDVVLVDGGGTTAAGPGPVNVSLSGSATDALGIGGCSNSGFFAGSITLGPDLVDDNSFSFAYSRGHAFHDPTSPLTAHASHNVGDTSNIGVALAAFATAPDPDATFSPPSLGVEVGVQAGVTFGPGAGTSVFPSRIGLEAGVHAGVVFGAGGSRQVMLTGAGVETPEMTAGGTEGQVLTYHEGSPPTWEDATGGGGGGGSVRVKEVDGSPNVSPVSTIRVSNGRLVDDGGGQVTITIPADAPSAGGSGDVAASAPGDTVAAGSTGKYADAGHRHAREAWGGSGDVGTLTFGAAAAAGSSGKVADAGHVHPMPANPVTAHEAASDPHPGYLTPTEGDAAYAALSHTHGGGASAPSDLGWFGDGSDGDVTISAGTTLTRDMYYNNLTVNSGQTLNTGGFRVFVKGTLTNNGTICRTPNRGNDAGTGGAALGNGTLTGAPKGGDRATSSGSAAGGNGSGTTTSGWGGNGGAGGQSSGGGAGGAAGTNTYTLNSQPRTLPMAINGAAQVLGTWTSVAGGSGGGAGGTTGILGSGGGGGSGGGVVVIAARSIANGSGVIHARGGAGGDGASNVGAGGGGGGGGGGVLILVYNELTGPGTIDAAGGAGGLAGSVAPAANGSAGSAGKVIQLQMT